MDREPNRLQLVHGCVRSGLHLLLFSIVSQIPSSTWSFIHGLNGHEGTWSAC